MLIPKIGVVLINLGTPEGPEVHHVKKYLKEFLMDPLVIDIAFPLRWFLVNQIILRTRPKNSAALYQKIWNEKGSPLLFHTLNLAQSVQTDLGEEFKVISAMRYGKPSIESAFVELKKLNVQRIMAFPLYPQYSLAATQSSVDECLRIAEKLKIRDRLEFFPAFYDQIDFIDSFSHLVKDVIKTKNPEKIIFSFHGVPERHVRKTDHTARTCLVSPHCCDQINESNSKCYRAQCFATARAIAKKVGIGSERYLVSFQSRLGSTPWIKPYTDIVYDELAQRGVKRIAVVCPSFVADCLETLEEVAIRGKEQYLRAGGEELHFIESLNSMPIWVKSVSQLIRNKV